MHYRLTSAEDDGYQRKPEFGAENYRHGQGGVRENQVVQKYVPSR